MKNFPKNVEKKMASHITEENIWKILKNYFDTVSIVHNQIDSWNNFVLFGMREVIEQEPAISVEGYTIRFGNVCLSSPQVIEEDRTSYDLYPKDARMRDLNYDSVIYVDIFETNKGEVTEQKVHNRVVIGRIPVMVKSSTCHLSKLSDSEMISAGECPNDPGGYFIIKGKERVIVSQIRENYNQIIVVKQKPGAKDKYVSMTRSMSTVTGHSVSLKCLLKYIDREVLQFSLPYVKEPIPIGVVFKALGYTEEEIPQILCLTHPKSYKFIKYILRDCAFCETKEDAYRYIGKFPIRVLSADESAEDYGKQIVTIDILPHLGIATTPLEQACFLATMVRKVIYTYLHIRNGESDTDERDNYANKRIETTGVLFYDLFRNIFKKFCQDIYKEVERKQRPDILSIISRNQQIVTKGFHRCLATGKWGIQKNATYVRQGVSQVLDRMTYMATLSHLRRCVFPIGREGKNSALRQIHGSSFGMLCPCETPEGTKVGTVLSMANLAKITRKIPMIFVRKIIEDHSRTITGIQEVELSQLASIIPVFLNGAVIGFTHDPEDTLKELRSFRQKKLLDNEVSITYDDMDCEIKIFCDEGRISRPFFVLEENRIITPSQEKYKWSKCLKNGWIRYLDASEIENCVIARDVNFLAHQRCDYAEIHPSTILGTTASLIPFPDHNQSPRNCYQSSMGRQALGIPMYTYNIRADTMLHILQYAQRPIVSTKYAEFLKTNDMPSGVNAIVAIMSYGYNQEDSIVLNQSSADRGLFTLISYHTIEAIEKKCDTYSYEEICVPPETTHNKKPTEDGYFERKMNCNYGLLDENGIVREILHEGDYRRRTKVRKGDIVIGKVMVNGNKAGKETKKDISVVIQADEEGYIEHVHTMVTPNGYKLVKIVISQMRKPELGDKLASRNAQKGTIGMTYRQEDLPWTVSGIVPDIIINSCCIPSRMTIGQLAECALGKICVTKGEYGDSTPFTEHSTNIADNIVEMGKTLKNFGMSFTGWETMYSGITGKQIKAMIFIGPTYYQRLKHMVVDKMHARARGHVTALTRQAVDGRAKDGGLRFGEMERDCQISHGNSAVLKERLYQVSDPFQISVCKSCGSTTSSYTECQVCKSNLIAKTDMPFASKLMFQEISGLCLKTSIKVVE